MDKLTDYKTLAMLAGITSADVARSIGVTKQYVSQIVAGQHAGRQHVYFEEVERLLAERGTGEIANQLERLAALARAI